MKCRGCGKDILTVEMPKCPACKTVNPDYKPAAGGAGSTTATRPPTGGSSATGSPTATGGAGAGNTGHATAGSAGISAFRNVAEILQTAKKNHWKIIGNLGLGAAGKSFLIARLAKTRPSPFNVALHCRATGQTEQYNLHQNQYTLPRTGNAETFLWSLPPPSNRHRGWLLVDIAGEHVNGGDFVSDALKNDSVKNLTLMTLALADALKVTIDGRKLAEDITGDPIPAERKPKERVDVTYRATINALATVVPRLRQWRESHPEHFRGDGIDVVKILEGLRAGYAHNQLGMFTGGPMRIPIPVLLVITKADHLFSELRRGGADAESLRDIDALKYAQAHLRGTYTQASNSLTVHRWQFCAPFIGQPQINMDEDMDVIDLDLPSAGVDQALRWLEKELSGDREPAAMQLTIRQAQKPVLRWLPGLGT
jgi:phage FluMu protein Com